jgi:hypothetical protein
VKKRTWMERGDPISDIMKSVFDRASHKEQERDSYLCCSLPLLLSNLVHHCRQRSVLFRGEGGQRRVSLCKDIVLCMEFSETVLLEVRVEFNLV